MLRGLGTLVALPVLEAMAPSIARAQGQAPVRRFLSFYVPNGIHMAAFTPSSMGPLQSAALPRILQPLAPHLAHVTVVSGLENRAGFADADGPGDQSDDPDPAGGSVAGRPRSQPADSGRGPGPAPGPDAGELG
jgi:hypothetical protein